MHIHTPISVKLIVTTAACLLFGAVGVRAAWQEAPNPPTVAGALTGALITNASGAQTKIGALTVLGNVDVPLVPSGVLTLNGNLCWNDTGSGTECRPTFPPTTASGVHRNVSTDAEPDAYDTAGSAWLQGNAPTQFALRVQAPPALGPTATYGVKGIAPAAVSGSSTGIRADALIDDPYHIAMYGFAAAPFGWAGYFDGKVAVAWPYDLYIGEVFDPMTGLMYPAIEEARFASGFDVPQVCLNQRCIDSWNDATSTGGPWSYTAGTNTIHPALSTSDWSVGSGSWNATFYVHRYANNTADVRIFGNTTVQSRVSVGSPSSTVPISYTCGDGICNGSESTSSCQIDCDTTAPGNIENLEPALDLIARKVFFSWTRPTIGPSVDPDYQGVRIVQKVGSPPSGPNDPLAAATYNVPNPGVSWTTPTLAANTTYYFAFYSYDAVNNYANGVVSDLVRFSGGPPSGPPCPFCGGDGGGG